MIRENLFTVTMREKGGTTTCNTFPSQVSTKSTAGTNLHQVVQYYSIIC